MPLLLAFLYYYDIFNKKIKASLNEDIIRSKFYDKWDGKLPQSMGSDSLITSIDGSSAN